MSFFKALMALDEDDNIHTARLLLLLQAFAGRSGENKINGLTKLVKLDFLLRYPIYFSRALKKEGISPEEVKIKNYEKRSVESKMIRYHYGPWDPRYRRFINILVGKGLCEVDVRGRTIYFGLTKEGKKVAEKLSQCDEFQDFVSRSILLKKHFEKSGTALKNFIYETFPEIVSLNKGDIIS